jgi:CRP-like cAMP-binding protein
VPRTATVTALTEARLFALDEEPFLVALTGHVPTAEAAERTVDERLASDEATGDESPD